MRKIDTEQCSGIGYCESMTVKDPQLLVYLVCNIVMKH
jgi:hypothetical protein